MKKILFVITAALFFYSCASAPSAIPGEPLEEEQPVEQVSEQMPEQAADQPEAEENLNQDLEDTDGKEDSEDEPLLEPVEDVEGYFETEIEPDVEEEPAEEEQQEENSPEGENTADEPLALLDQESNPRTGAVVKENPEIIRAQSPETEPTGSAGKQEAAPSVATGDTSENPATAVPPVAMQELMSTGTVAAPKEDDGSQIQVSQLMSEEIEAQEEPEAPAVAKIEIVPSRTATMKNNQYLDIEYPGKGWIYLGEEDSKELMRYFGKKIGEKNTTFCLRSRETGTTILHFYKNDALTDRVIDDYLIVEISGTNDGTRHAVAPLYAETIPQKPEKPSEAARRKAMEESLAVKSQDDGEAESTRITDVKPHGTQMAPASGTPASSAPAPEAPISGKAPSTIARDAARPAPVAVPVPSTAPSARTPVQPSSSSLAAEDSGAVTVIENRNSTGENNSSSGEGSRSMAPEEPKVSQAQKEKQNAKIQDTSDLASEEILRLARKSFDEKKYAETLAYLEDFFAKAATKIDEGLFIQGQVFESNNPFRNIKSALDTYETIVRRYPQSIHWAKANERVTYLRKFYFNIR